MRFAVIAQITIDNSNSTDWKINNGIITVDWRPSGRISIVLGVKLLNESCFKERMNGAVEVAWAKAHQAACLFEDAKHDVLPVKVFTAGRYALGQHIGNLASIQMHHFRKGLFSLLIQVETTERLRSR